MLKGYESSPNILLQYYLSTFIALPKSKNHSIFLEITAIDFCPFPALVGEIWLMKGFSGWFGLCYFWKKTSHSSLSFLPLCIPKRPELKPRKKTLTAMVFLRSTTIVKNTLGGFLTLPEKGHKAHKLFAETVHITESPQPHQTRFICTAGITSSG